MDQIVGLGYNMENWKMRKGSLIDVSQYGFSCDIENEKKIIIEVWGDTEKECLSRTNKICKVNEMHEALEDISRLFFGSLKDEMDELFEKNEKIAIILKSILKEIDNEG